MKYNLNLNDRAFNAIINETKRIEIRANTGGYDYSKFNRNDFVCFTNFKNETINCKIIEVNHYNSIEELLTLEGTKYTTSSTNDYNVAIKSINSLTGYKEEIPKTGVNAIHIKYLYKNDDIWNELYERAKSVLNPRKVSDRVEVGGVATEFYQKKAIFTQVYALIQLAQLECVLKETHCQL